MIIQITKDSIKNNKAVIILTILLSLSIYYFVIPKIVENVKIEIAKYQINKIVDSQWNEMLNIENEILENEKEKKISDLNMEYSNKKDNIKNNYELIISEYKNKLIAEKIKAIKLWNDDQKIWFIEKSDIEINLLKKLNTVFTNSINISENKIKDIESKKSLTLSAWYDKTEISNIQEKIDWYDTKTYSFELIIKKRVNDLEIYDKSKLWIPIDLWINLPSLFSYKNNGISMPDNYYDMHKGVDFKTMPYKNIVIKFPINKQWVVVYNWEDWYWKRLIIDNKKDNERYEYAHLEDIGVKVWDTIVWWQKIATTWNSWPYSQWYHLHYSFYKNWLLSTFDWWMDMDHKELIRKKYPDKNNELFLDYIDKVPANIPQALWIFLQLPEEKKNKENLDKIMSLFTEYEKKWVFSLKDILWDKYFKDTIKKSTNDLFNEVIKHVEDIDSIRKWSMIAYIKENSKEDITLYDQSKITKQVSQNNENKSVSNKNKFNMSYLANALIQEKVSKLDLWECMWIKSNVFENYVPYQSISDWHIINKQNIDNINKLFPLILSVVKEKDYAEKINTQIGLTWNKKINNCEIALIEIWKWYQEHTLYLDNPNKHGIFQHMSHDYYNEFPDDKWKNILSDKQYRKQINDSLDHSFWKLSYIKWTSFRWRNVDNDFVLKYLLWSYHWLIWDDPDKDYYVSNNLIYNGLKIVDRAATPWKIWEKDGAFTIAVKLYKISTTL